RRAPGDGGGAGAPRAAEWAAARAGGRGPPPRLYRAAGACAGAAARPGGGCGDHYHPRRPAMSRPMRVWPAKQRPEALGALSAARARDRSERATLLRARRRQAVIFAVIAAMLALLFGRAAYWQIAHHAELAAWADAQQLRAIAVPTGRGAIYDANGRLLALSVTQDTVIADPDSIRSAGALETTAARLAVLVGLPPVAVRRQLDVPGAYVRLRDTGGRLLLLSQAQSDAVNAARQQGELTGVTPIPEVR